jgi:hypothetical protein
LPIDEHRVAVDLCAPAVYVERLGELGGGSICRRRRPTSGGGTSRDTSIPGWTTTEWWSSAGGCRRRWARWCAGRWRRRLIGCARTHVRHWADDGPTRLDNLVLLCRRHHQAVHWYGERLDLGYAIDVLWRPRTDLLLAEAARTRRPWTDAGDPAGTAVAARATGNRESGGG